MKQLIRTLIPLIVTLATFPAALLAQGQLAVAAYPGAVAVAHQPGEPLNCGRLKAPAEKSVFLSKDDAAKVGDFYKPKVKSAYESAQQGSTYFVLEEWTTEEGANWVGAEVYGGVDAWTEGRFPLFDDLRLEVDGENHTEDDYNEIYAQYKYLDTAFFNCTEERDDSGALLDEGQVAIRQITEAREAEGAGLNSSADELEAKIKKLVSEGRYEEAAAVGQQFAAQVTGTLERDRWSEVVAAIEELGAKAYKTMIVIDPPRAK